METGEIMVPVSAATLQGELRFEQGNQCFVLFAHGSGSSRHSPRNQFVARVLRDAGIGTFLFDLLTPQEEQEEAYNRHLRFDISLLAQRLAAATHSLLQQPELKSAKIGYFGASTGAAAA